MPQNSPVKPLEKNLRKVWKFTWKCLEICFPTWRDSLHIPRCGLKSTTLPGQVIKQLELKLMKLMKRADPWAEVQGEVVKFLIPEGRMQLHLVNPEENSRNHWLSKMVFNELLIESLESIIQKKPSKITLRDLNQLPQNQKHLINGNQCRVLSCPAMPG